MIDTPSIQSENQSENQSEKTERLVFEDEVGNGKRYFVISRGKTQHPKREIRSNEYQIGSGEGCDLRLGGGEIPALHCILNFVNGTSTIQSVASTPALRINGAEVITHELLNGDLVEIGPFQFEFHQEEVSAIAEISRDKSTVETFEAEEELDLAGLSAEELVDLLETDMKLVEENENRKRKGLEALTAEVQARMPDLADQVSKSETHDREVVEEFVQITHQLCEHVIKLERRFSRISQRETVYTSAFSDLLESQKLLSNHLETLIAHLASLEGLEEPKQRSRFAA